MQPGGGSLLFVCLPRLPASTEEFSFLDVFFFVISLFSFFGRSRIVPLSGISLQHELRLSRRRRLRACVPETASEMYSGPVRNLQA